MPWMSINEWKKKNKVEVKATKKSKPEKAKERFLLRGFDTFSSDWYDIGSYATEAEAKEIAQEVLRENERLQPTSSSGGQSGIQDRVFIERPDGSRYRVFPKL